MPQTIETVGTKEPGCAAHHGDGTPACGPWTATRTFYIHEPNPYDFNQPYPLIIQAPGCGGTGRDVYALTPFPNMIRVGVSPGPNDLGHGTNPEQGCFDDKEGDDSIDWPFYEKLYDKLNVELCFDRNRVFASGNSSGAWFANELGCKYAGDALRPIRGVMTHRGGLPTEQKYLPTCSTAPLAGMWVHEVTDATSPFDATKVALDRAMSLGGCPAGQVYDTSQFEDFLIQGYGYPVCKRIVGCDPLTPLVVCPLPGNGRSGHDDLANPGFSEFVKAFEAPPLLTE
jgi:hypothetical protein